MISTAETAGQIEEGGQISNASALILAFPLFITIRANEGEDIANLIRNVSGNLASQLDIPAAFDFNDRPAQAELGQRPLGFQYDETFFDADGNRVEVGSIPPRQPAYNVNFRVDEESYNNLVEEQVSEVLHMSNGPSQFQVTIMADSVDDALAFVKTMMGGYVKDVEVTGVVKAGNLITEPYLKSPLDFYND